MNESPSTPAVPVGTSDLLGDLKLDDFCAEAIREMRGMPSFAPLRDNGNAARGRRRAVAAFGRALRRTFPALTDDQRQRLCRWSMDRARGWSSVTTAREILNSPNTQGVGRRDGASPAADSPASPCS